MKTTIFHILAPDFTRFSFFFKKIRAALSVASSVAAALASATAATASATASYATTSAATSSDSLDAAETPGGSSRSRRTLSTWALEFGISCVRDITQFPNAHARKGPCGTVQAEGLSTRDDKKTFIFYALVTRWYGSSCYT